MCDQLKNSKLFLKGNMVKALSLPAAVDPLQDSVNKVLATIPAAYSPADPAIS